MLNMQLQPDCNREVLTSLALSTTTVLLPLPVEQQLLPTAIIALLLTVAKRLFRHSEVLHAEGLRNIVAVCGRSLICCMMPM
jgi:hypothetical protein